jgi:hypothetical protein
MKLKLLVLAFGLLFFSCAEKEKECPDCGEHGICNETTKECSCLPGYNGDKCQFEKAPNSMIITGVRVRKYPALNNGVSWDNFSNYADPYVVLYKSNGVKLYEGSYYEEISPNTSFSWSTYFEVNPLLEVKLILYDYDSGATDSEIGTLFFIPYEAGLNFPLIKTIEKNGMIVDIFYLYQF